MTEYDLILKNGKVVIPRIGVLDAEIGVKDGKIKAIAKEISASAFNKTLDVKGNVILPGIVDAHSHFGIYRPFEEDVRSESKAAVTGGITTVLNIIRPRPYYLNHTGPLTDLLSKLLNLSKGNYLTDYGYALAPVEAPHLNELDELVKNGVATFKYFMHYRDYKFSDEPYDTGFLLKIMEKVAEINKSTKGVRVSLHCEDPEIIRVKGRTGYGIVLEEKNSEGLREDANPLELYHEARPPLAEAIAVARAILMAKETTCPINILHVTSKLAIETIRNLIKSFEIDLTTEATVHHLTLTTESHAGVFGKVNPPIRKKEDVEDLWDAIMEGTIHVVASDHAATPIKLKQADVWKAMFGFGGNTLLCPIMISEGYHKRKIPLEKIAELISYNPAKIHGFYPRKGNIMLNSDADFTVIDLKITRKVTPEILNSAQEYTPFEGLEVKGWPIFTIIRGEVIFEEGQVKERYGYGEFIKRPASYFYS